MRLNLTCSYIALLTTAMPVAAQAQSEPSGPTAATNQEQGGQVGLEDIVVTAQRRSENLQNVPISISAVTASKLSASGISSAQDLSVAVPALTINNSIGYFLPRLRGIGSTSIGPGVENSVATYIDNVYIASSAASLFTFNDVERVEVLKGPQGTLFGRNATGGLINVITKDPSHDSGGDASISYANYNTISGNVYLTTSLGDTAAINFAATGSHQGKGFGRNLFTGQDVNRTDEDIALRSKLLWEPGPTTQVRLSGDYEITNGNYPSIREFEDEQPAFGVKTGGRPWDTNNDGPSRTKITSGGVTLRIDQGLGELQLVSISAYRKSRFQSDFDFDLSPTPALDIGVNQKDHQVSQELQLQSGDNSSIKWVTGVYYFHGYSGYVSSDLNIGAALNVPAGPFFPFVTLRNVGNVQSDSYAAFGQVTLPLTSTTNVTGGLRFTSERRNIDGDSLGILSGGAAISLIAPGSGVQGKTFRKLTWRISVDQKLGDTLLYASYNRGFKAGGFNLGTPDLPSYVPEVLDAYEIGLKADLFDRRLRFNPAFFYYDYSNLQVALPLLNGSLSTVNGPSAKVYGFDLDGEALVSEAFRVTFGVTLLHDRYGNYPNAIANSPLLTGGNTSTQFNARGNRLPFTSDFVSSLGANYRINLGRSNLVFQADWSHNDGYFTNTDNLRRQRAFDTINASLTWAMQDDRFSVKGFVKNLANEDVIVFNNITTAVTAATYQPPRTYGLTVSMNF
jgi:iron complex outermembrane receptor protein